jgi:hypothetical protein
MQKRFITDHKKKHIIVTFARMNTGWHVLSGLINRPS